MNHEEAFQDSFKVKAWQQALATNQIQLRSVENLYSRHGKDGTVLYSLVKLDAQTPEGSTLAPLCFIKGDAVSMVVVLINAETGDKFVLLVRQRRVCDGSITYEHPAGMIEQGETPLDVAVRELHEETGLDVRPDEVIPLGPKPWFSATATSDEALYFFYCERRLSAQAIRAMHGKKTGEESENEHTELHVATFPEAHQLVSNLHGIMGHLLYLQAIADYETMKSLPF